MSENVISVIIPALNEEAIIGDAINYLKDVRGIEIILVDGGSSDDTAAIAGPLAHRVISAPRGRATQMNAGAREARGNMLFFLHADCLPPPSFVRLITDALETPGVVAGAFDIRIAHSGLAFRLIERMANLRSRLTGVPYGDQGLFITRQAFQASSGFTEIPIMEDIEMGQRLKLSGRIRFISGQPILVSPRRWLSEGIAVTTLRDWGLALAYTVLGVRPEALARHYRDQR